MKKTIACLLLLSLITACTIPVNAESPAPYPFSSEGFTVWSLPGGTWSKFVFDDGSVYFYGNTQGTVEDGMITFMVQQPEELAGVQLDDATLSAIYDDMLHVTAESGVEMATLGEEDAVTAGVLSRTVWYRGLLSGVMFSHVLNAVIIDGKIFMTMYIHPGKDLDTMRNEMNIIINSVVYEGEGIESASVPENTDYDYPDATEETPLPLELHLMAGRDTPTAVWMMDEDARAACTVLLMMDEGLFNQQELDNPPQYDILNAPSYIGCVEDLIYVIVPVKGMKKAIIYLFDNAADTASYYFTDWSSDALAAFEAKADQFYENSPDALLKYMQQLYADYNSAIGAGE